MHLEKNLNRKKTLWLMICMMLVFLCTGCGSTGGTNGNGTASVPEGNLADIVEQIYDKKDPGIDGVTIPIELSDSDMVKMYTGLDSVDAISEAVASESMMGVQAYSLVLVRVIDEDETAEVAKAMRAGIDQRKWICVEADDLQVVGSGDIVMLFMVSSDFSDTVTSDEMVDAFKEVCGGTLTVE